MSFTSNCEYRKWIQTDDNQWLFRNAKNEFWLINIDDLFWENEDEDSYGVRINCIDLYCYSLDFIKEVLGFYGYITIRIDSQLIAECLSECEDSQITGNIYFKGTLEECENWVKEEMKEFCKENFNLKEEV